MRPTQTQLNEVSQAVFGKVIDGVGHIWKAIGDHYGKSNAWAIRYATAEDVDKMLKTLRRKATSDDLAKLSKAAIACGREEYGADADEIVDLIRSGDQSEWWNDWDIELNDDAFANELRSLHDAQSAR